MGYYTEHTLYAKGIKDEETFNAINNWLKAANLIGYAFEDCDYSDIWDADGVWYTGDAVKWYNSDDDMRRLAHEFPDIKFKLMCRGEDSEEWAMFYWGDKFEEVDRPEFDPVPTEFTW